MRGLTNLNLGHTEDSIEDWNRAIELNPDNYEYWLERGWRKFDLGDITGAIDDMINARDRGPDVWFAQFSLGAIYYMSGQDQYKDEAHQALDIAIDLEPTNPTSRGLRGELKLHHFGDPASALEDLDIAVEYADPNDPHPLGLRGDAYRQLGELGGCIDDFNIAIEIDEQNPSYYWMQGDCLAANGDTGHARVRYEVFLELAGNDPKFTDQVIQVEAWLSEN